MSPTHGKILKSRDFIRHQIGKTVGTQISDFPLPASLCAHLSFFHGANIPLTLGKLGNHYPLRAHYLIQLTSRETTFRESKCIFPFFNVEIVRGGTAWKNRSILRYHPLPAEIGSWCDFPVSNGDSICFHTHRRIEFSRGRW